MQSALTEMAMGEQDLLLAVTIAQIQMEEDETAEEHQRRHADNSAGVKEPEAAAELE